MKRVLILCLVLSLLCGTASAAVDSVSDWNALIAARHGERNDSYLRQLWKYVSDKYEDEGGLDRIRATEWHRISLTVLALGGDPTAFGEVDGQPIDLIADGTYNWSGELSAQGSNALVYALLTLDAYGYAIPEGAAYTRERLVSELLTYQKEDGGFGLSVSTGSDVDMTAMALQALSRYDEPQAIEAAVDYLSAAQTARGDFETVYGTVSAESSAQVVLALCDLGIDPRTDERFCKTGGSAYDGLLQFQMSDGSFCHALSEGKSNSLATAQAQLALCAMERMDAGKSRLLDFTGEPRIEWRSGFPTVWVISGAAALCLAAGLLIWRKKTWTK